MTTTATYAGMLSLTEMGIGSLLHAFHIPFSGHFLSLNQIAILSQATRSLGGKSAPMEISAIAAILKSLSPTGKKVTPMLAIAMQGLLFNCGTFICGNGVVGRVLGACLSALWSFIQPALIYTLIFGGTLWTAVTQTLEQLLPAGSFGILIGALIGGKCLLAAVCAIFPACIPLSYFKGLNQRASTKPTQPQKNIFFMAFRDMLRPLFLFSLILTLAVFYILNAPTDMLFWLLVRPLAFGYLFFILIRWLPIEKVIALLEKRHKTSFGKSLQEALEYVKTE